MHNLKDQGNSKYCKAAVRWKFGHCYFLIGFLMRSAVIINYYFLLFLLLLLLD